MVEANLVDDAVVEIENMERHMAMGKSAWEAAFDSSDEVGLAVIASSATIIAVFLPVAFMGGIPGQFFQPFGVTVAVSTIFSTLVARMVTPMMGAYLLKEAGSREKGAGGVIRLFNFKFAIPGRKQGNSLRNKYALPLNKYQERELVFKVSHQVTVGKFINCPQK